MNLWLVREEDEDRKKQKWENKTRGLEVYSGSSVEFRLSPLPWQLVPKRIYFHGRIENYTEGEVVVRIASPPDRPPPRPFLPLPADFARRKGGRGQTTAHQSPCIDSKPPDSVAERRATGQISSFDLVYRDPPFEFWCCAGNRQT